MTNGVASIIDEGDFESERWYRILQDQKVTVWYTAPTAIRMLMKAGPELPRQFDLHRLRFLASVGEPLNPEAVVWGKGDLRRATSWAALSGQVFGWFLISMGGLFFFAGQIPHGIWLVLIGLFLNSAARSSYEQVLMDRALRGEPVSRFMTREPIVVPPELDLGNWVDDFVYRHHRKVFPVVSHGHLVGTISTTALARYPRGDWDRHTVAEAMDKDVEGISIAPDAGALDALRRMQRAESSRLLVVDGARLVGIVSLKDLLDFLNLKLELEDVKH